PLLESAANRFVREPTAKPSGPIKGAPTVPSKGCPGKMLTDNTFVGPWAGTAPKEVGPFVASTLPGWPGVPAMVLTVPSPTRIVRTVLFEVSATYTTVSKRSGARPVAIPPGLENRIAPGLT